MIGGGRFSDNEISFKSLAIFVPYENIMGFMR